MNEIIEMVAIADMFAIVLGMSFLIIGYLSFLNIIFSEHKFNKIFLWSKKYAEKNEKISGVLIALEVVLSFINIPMLLLSNWRLRLRKR